MLKKRIKEKTPNVTNNNNITNNITNNNNNNNTININIVGKETLEHITEETLVSLLTQVLNKHNHESIYVTSGEAVIAYMREKHKDENNINVIVPHARSQISYIKRNQEKGFEPVDTIQAVEETFSNTARQMNEQLSIYKEKKGEFIRKAQRVHSCIDNMGNRGTKGANAIEVHRIKRECKVGLIRERSTCANAKGVRAP